MDLPPSKLPEFPDIAQRLTPRGDGPKKPPKRPARVRIMPAVIIAIVCVLAVKAIDMGRNFGEVRAATQPEAAKKAEPKGATDKHAEVDQKVQAGALADAGTAPVGESGTAPVTPDLTLAASAHIDGTAKLNVAQCPGTSVAEQAGLSAAEAQVLQSLADRRKTLDGRDGELSTREQLLASAEKRIEQRLTEMKALQARVQQALGGLDEKADADTAALVSVYEKMKPKAAAAVMETLDDDVALRVARRMKVATLATIMSSMSPPRAKHLTELMAKRVDTAKKVAESAIAGNAAPKPKPAPKKTAAANPAAAAAPAAAPPAPGA
jgi:flagellar motility protein MotE (MotC chaperone)